ncbi:hypothetical protein M513_06138 [Trichuris suis]|uniref:Uncharacterized protein n=1 Tax=Trichuris suis TaxID=68888 RepID=A0A085M726_9BILA|nr:hypothetical protein M513_06138 [Trichuris suis]
MTVFTFLGSDSDGEIENKVFCALMLPKLVLAGPVEQQNSEIEQKCSIEKGLLDLNVTLCAHHQRMMRNATKGSKYSRTKHLPTAEYYFLRMLCIAVQNVLSLVHKQQRHKTDQSIRKKKGNSLDCFDVQQCKPMNLTHNPALLGLVDDVSYWKWTDFALPSVHNDKATQTPGSPTQRKSP